MEGSNGRRRKISACGCRRLLNTVLSKVPANIWSRIPSARSNRERVGGMVILSDCLVGLIRFESLVELVLRVWLNGSCLTACWDVNAFA